MRMGLMPLVPARRCGGASAPSGSMSRIRLGLAGAGQSAHAVTDQGPARDPRGPVATDSFDPILRTKLCTRTSILQDVVPMLACRNELAARNPTSPCLRRLMAEDAGDRGGV